MYAKYSTQCLNQRSQTTCPPKQAIQGDETPKTNLNLIGNQGKCRRQGHIAKDCPTKKSEKAELVRAPQGNRSQPAHELKARFNNAHLNCDIIMKDLEHIKRMILSIQAEKVSGTKEIRSNQEENDSTIEKVFSDQSQKRGGRTPLLNEVAIKEDKSVNDTIQIKEEPPDSQPIDQTRGNLLNPQTIKDSNLFYLCACIKVLRTKPLEEGGDDVRINTNIDLTIADEPADRLAERPAEELAEGLSDGLPEVLLVSRQLVPIKESYHFLPLCASQSHIWKPGDILNHLESVPHNHSCIFLRKNPMSHNFPIPESNEIKSQRLYCDHILCIQKLLTMYLDVPRHHHYLPKLSRLKKNQNFPISA
ncbi:unnamed protein product, partial [Arabidopsis halleri]